MAEFPGKKQAGSRIISRYDEGEAKIFWQKFWRFDGWARIFKCIYCVEIGGRPHALFGDFI